MNQMWTRTSRERPCPVCGKSDWCMVSSNRAVVICPRVEEGSRKYLDGSGYLHILDKTKPVPVRTDEGGSELPEHNIVLSQLASKMMACCDDERVSVLAADLGVPTFALRLLRVGWSASSDAYSFPMWRDGQRLVGIRIRSMSGKKWAIKGSRQGLFMPMQWPSRRKGIVVCEGPTDTAALLGLGLNAIGRPSAMGSHALVDEVVEGSPVCIISDSDKVGIDSSTKLASHLKKQGNKVCVIIPPAKDARDWIAGREKASAATIRTCISEAFRSSGPYYCPSTFREPMTC